PGGEGDPGDLHVLAQVAETAHVDLVVHPVHHRAGAEEQAGLEEAVGDQVEDRERVPDRAQAGGEHHVPDLRHRRGGQRLLQVVLGATHDRPEQQGDGTDDHHHELGGGGTFEDRPGADYQVYTGGDHRGGVDQCGHRGGAGHRVPEPGL